MTKVLFDTNIIIDYLTDRVNGVNYSKKVLMQAIDGEIEGYICAKQLTDIYYILRKYNNLVDRRKILSLLSDTFTVLPLLPSFTKFCINSNMSDYEDAVLDEVAKVNMINFIVTNNLKDFEKAKTTIIAPKELYSLVTISNNGYIE